MKQDNVKEETSYLYWLMLGAMFASFFAVALS